MRFQNLGSGVVSFDGQALLIDCGLTKERVLRGLHGFKLRGVVITHRHGDHLQPHALTLAAPVYIEEANWRDARMKGRPEHFYELPFRVGPFRVSPFPLPHPGAERWNSWGFRVEAGGATLAYATDLGHVPGHVIDAMSGAALVFLESNHDVEMEKRSHRPDSLKQWVLSDHGHLSNEQCSAALSKIKGARTVVLGHLSHECNTVELARKQAKGATKAELVIADQETGTVAIDVTS